MAGGLILQIKPEKWSVKISFGVQNGLPTAKLDLEAQGIVTPKDIAESASSKESEASKEKRKQVQAIARDIVARWEREIRERRERQKD
jgi:hypothetical protein